MDEEDLDPFVRDALIDRLEGWELVDFLQIPTEQIIEVFSDLILENIQDIEDLIGLRSNTDE